MNNNSNKRHVLQPLQSLIEDISAPILQKRGFQSPAIIHDWHKILGEELAQKTKPIKITFMAKKRHQGTLHITADAMTAMIIQHQQKDILRKVNSYFGYKAVDYLKIYQIT